MSCVIPPAGEDEEAPNLHPPGRGAVAASWCAGADSWAAYRKQPVSQSGGVKFHEESGRFLTVIANFHTTETKRFVWVCLF